MSQDRSQVGPTTYIIVATYHEEDNIGAVLYHLARTVTTPFFLIVDDSEDDKTCDAAAETLRVLGFTAYRCIKRKRKLGLGSAYRAAAAELCLLSEDAKDRDCSQDLVAILDADLSHDPCDIQRLVDRLHAADADIAAGSRYCKGGSVSGWPFRRAVVSGTANFLAQTVLGLQGTDCTSSMRAYRRDTFLKLISQTISTGFAIQLELMTLATRTKCTVTEMPICFTERINGQSSFRIDEILKFTLLIVTLWARGRHCTS